MRFARLGIFCAVCVGFFPRLTNFLQVRVLHLPDEVGSGLKTFCRLLIGFPVPGDGVDESRLIRLVVLGMRYLPSEIGRDIRLWGIGRQKFPVRCLAFEDT